MANERESMMDLEIHESRIKYVLVDDVNIILTHNQCNGYEKKGIIIIKKSLLGILNREV